MSGKKPDASDMSTVVMALALALAGAVVMALAGAGVGALVGAGIGAWARGQRTGASSRARSVSRERSWARVAHWMHSEDQETWGFVQDDVAGDAEEWIATGLSKNKTLWRVRWRLARELVAILGARAGKTARAMVGRFRK